MTAPSGRAIEVLVGIGDLRVAQAPVRSIVTHALGSCVGVFAWDPVTRVGGCLHYMLPTSDGTGHPDRFGDTGLARLVRGVAPTKAAALRLQLYACGGAAMLEEATFRIGPRNVAALNHFLWSMGLRLVASDLGGNRPRTARLDLDTGRVAITMNNTTSELEIA